ncbi:N-acetyltransferase [Arenibacter sp. 6A1]|uniref:GNAT family N-acetyltransferase n=1 Tax=Arenibacter sp. 6A1 TaxID=2720391 RepID=UPI0014464DC0|nr:GNAT family N-acetyltransferase [Arenibacter sp. 6A1]NKI26618.1 N-acetyltransferase [Arenibacter sp. 6A1]
MSYELIHNKKEHRFQVSIDGHMGIEEYKLFPGGIAYIHTEVPKALAGQGVGSFIAKGVLDYAAQQGLKVKPVCPFIKAYIDRHHKYQANSIAHQDKKS